MPEALAYRQATRRAVKARVALVGPSGSGKTYTGLVLATGLAEGDGVAVIDTEKGSASLYAEEFSFDVLELGPPFHPERYVGALRLAERAGYASVLIDSLSHAWFDEGGVLDIVDRASGKGGNKFAGWQQGTPAQNALIGAIVRSPLHVVATMRTKTEYVQETVGGRTTIRKLGTAPVQRDNIEYEFAVVGELDPDHVMALTKSRFKTLQDRTFRRPGPEVAELLLAEFRRGETEVPQHPPAGGSSPGGPTLPDVQWGGGSRTSLIRLA